MRARPPSAFAGAVLAGPHDAGERRAYVHLADADPEGPRPPLCPRRRASRCPSGCPMRRHPGLVAGGGSGCVSAHCYRRTDPVSLAPLCMACGWPSARAVPAPSPATARRRPVPGKCSLPGLPVPVSSRPEHGAIPSGTCTSGASCKFDATFQIDRGRAESTEPPTAPHCGHEGFVVQSIPQLLNR